MFGMPKVLDDAMKAKERESRVADGIIHSAMLTSFQRDSMDGIVKSALPERSPVSAIHSVKASATQHEMGVVHYPGTRYPKRR